MINTFKWVSKTLDQVRVIHLIDFWELESKRAKSHAEHWSQSHNTHTQNAGIVARAIIRRALESERESNLTQSTGIRARKQSYAEHWIQSVSSHRAWNKSVTTITRRALESERESNHMQSAESERESIHMQSAESERESIQSARAIRTRARDQWYARQSARATYREPVQLESEQEQSIS